MIAVSLQSGSNGNCLYVETEGARLIFDAGLPGAEAAGRLAALGRDIRSADALIISHDHADHARYAGVYQRKFGLPVYMTAGTLKASMARHGLGRLDDVRLFKAGQTLGIGGASLLTIATPHDGVEGAAFVVASGGKRLGILTDLGHVFEGLRPVVASLDAVFIESNYDPAMLASGRYPASLKRRIAGPEGHISNQDAAELLLAGARLRWACLAHLSENTNDAQTALQTHRSILGAALPLYVASRYMPTGMMSL